jgi:ribosomal protein L16 Arg81 hydroxylase
MLQLPVDSTAFRERYFERQPALWRGALLGHSLTLKDVDHAIEQIKPDERCFQLFAQGLVRQHQYTHDGVELGRMRRRLDKERFYAYLRAGATVVLNGFEDHSLVCRRLVEHIGRFAGVQATGNAYLSFAGNGTFGKHWDTHDVFAIQLIGRKRWQVYAPTWLLPLSHQTSDSAVQHETGAPQMDVILERGDVLYLPRGWWHQVLPCVEPSFHLSVGTYAATTYDFLMWTMAQLLPQHETARKAFPFAADDAAAIAKLFDALRDAVLDPAVARRFQLELHRRERHHGELDLGRQAAKVREAFPPNAVVRLTTTSASAPQEARLFVNGQLIELDPLGRELVGVLRSSAATTLDALCARVSAIPRAAIEQALLDLSQRDVISIDY